MKKLAASLCLALCAAACGATPAGSSAPDGGGGGPGDAGVEVASPDLGGGGDAPVASPDLASPDTASPDTASPDTASPDAPTGLDAPIDKPDAPATSDATDTAGAVDTGPAPSDGGAVPSPLPVGFPAGAAARTESKSFMGPTTHTTIGFQIYLPPGYDGGTLRYPVVYDLHGLTGSQFEDPQWVVPSLEAAMKKNLIGPVIVVFPDGLMESYYADGKNGVKPSETRIVRELIPYVDATYRTVAHRQLRAVTGFSMGGYGAMELATKLPDVFRAGVAYDAALDTWQTLVGRRAYIATAQFGDDQAWFDLYSPWANATKNAVTLRARGALRLVPGTTYQMFDAAYRDHLKGLSIPLDYVETTCPHDYGCAIGAQGAASWTFIQAAFAKP